MASRSITADALPVAAVGAVFPRWEGTGGIFEGERLLQLEECGGLVWVALEMGTEVTMATIVARCAVELT
jgi:hypothetical protein